MGYEDEIDALIAEGYKKVTLCPHMLITEDDSRVQQLFLLSQNGQVVARKLNLPGCIGWTILHWPAAPYRSSDLKEIWGIDLTQRDEAMTRLCFFI
ncbi:TPA: hypothetical protein ACXNPR_004238 [Enterobacter cancerogenus]|nr:hypothetical protein [Enterobacter hormaechei]